MEILDDVYTQSDFLDDKTALPVEMLQQWTLTRRWTRFLSILGIFKVVAVGITLASIGLFMKLFGILESDINSPLAYGLQMIARIGILSTVFISALGIFMYFFLVSFGNLLRQGLEQQDQTKIEHAWLNMLYYTRIVVVLFGLFVLFYLFITLLALSSRF